MESKHYILLAMVVAYVALVYLFSRIGNRREIGSRRLFWISLFLTPVLGCAFYISSQHKKMVMYTEQRYKCEECGYVFSEEHEHCPFCAKEGRISELKPVNMFMT